MRPGMRWTSLSIASLVLFFLLGAAAPAGDNGGSRRLAAVTPESPAGPVSQPGSAQPPEPEPDPMVQGPPVPPKAEKVLQRIPVLMYHEIGDKPNNNYLNEQVFDQQMRWLAENGYHGVTLGEAYHHFHDGVAIVKRPVVITFDDGYETFYTKAVPILRKYGFRATSFVITGSLGHRESMTWAMVEELPKLGMEVGAHTRTHPDLRSLSGERLRSEIAGSKQDLEERLKVPVEFFCYPSGESNPAVVAAVKQAGFLAATTTQYGPATPAQDPYLLSRVRISRLDGVQGFAAKITGASDPDQ